MILTIFGRKLSQQRDLFFEKNSNERRRHRGIVVVIVAVVVVVGRFWVASITGPSLLTLLRSADGCIVACRGARDPCVLLFISK